LGAIVGAEDVEGSTFDLFLPLSEFAFLAVSTCDFLSSPCEAFLGGITTGFNDFFGLALD
jgi:hypothetical protein